MAQIPVVTSTDQRSFPQAGSISHGTSLGWLILLWCFGGLIVCGLGVALKDVISLSRDREAYENAVAAEAAQKQALHEQIKQQQGELTASTQEHAKLQAETNDLNQKKLELTGAVTKETSTLDLKKKELQQVEQLVRTGLADRSKLDAEVESARTQLTALTKNFEALSTQASDLNIEKKALDETVANLKLTQTTLLKDLQAKNDELEKAKTSLADIETQMREAKTKRDATDAALVPLIQEEARINGLLLKNIGLTNKHDQLTNSLNQLEMSVADAKAKETAAKADLDKLKMEIEAAEKARAVELPKQAQLLAEVKVLEVNKTQLEADAKGALAKKAQIDADIQTATEAEATAKEKLAKSKSEIEVAEVNLKDEMTKHARLVGENNSLATTKTQLEMDVQAATNAKTKLNADVKTLEASQPVLNDSISSLKADKEALRLEIEQYKTDATNLQDQVKRRRDELSSLMKTIEQNLPKKADPAKDASQAEPKTETSKPIEPTDKTPAKTTSETGN